MNLFDVLNNISQGTEDVSKDPDFKKAFNSYMIPRYLSMHRDTIFMANLMNKFPNLPPHIQYKFYLKAVTKKKRYFKYAKKESESEKNLDVIMKYYGVNSQKALDIIQLLTSEQINKISEKICDEGRIK